MIQFVSLRSFSFGFHSIVSRLEFTAKQSFSNLQVLARALEFQHDEELLVNTCAQICSKNF